MPPTVINGDQYGDTVGVSSVYAAIVQKDDTTGYVAAPDIDFLAPVADVSQESATNTTPRYYSNIARYVSNTEGESTVTLTVSGVPTQLAAKYLGKGYDAATGRIIDSGQATAPWAAITFAADVEGTAQGGGNARKYYAYLKGRFSPINEEAATKTDDIDVRTTTLKFSAVTTIYNLFVIPNPDGVGSTIGPAKRVVGDNRLNATENDQLWFSAIQVPVDSVGTANTAFKLGLKSLVATAGPLVQATYTPASWTPFLAAKTSATTVNSNASATKAQVVNAENALRAAIEGLVAV